MTKVFISYNHQEAQWVLKRLMPCLEAGGAEVIIDRQQFTVGQPVVGQMDAWQDQADKHLLILSPEYLNSRYCRHEMRRALQRMGAQPNCVVPVLRHPCNLPKAFSGWNPLLYVNLCDDQQRDPWANVLRSCNANLGTTALNWLAVRDDVVDYLNRNQCVNLIVRRGLNWRKLIDHITRDYLTDLALVDLEDPDTISRKGLLTTIIKAFGAHPVLSAEPQDVADFKAFLNARPSVARVTLIHSDLIPFRCYYDVDLFAGLRYLIEQKKLVFLVQSHTSLSDLLPKNHPLSNITIYNVKLGL